MNDAGQLQLGLSTFGDITRRPDGTDFTHAEIIRQVVDQAALADQVGVSAFTLGEHHRPDFAVSSPDMVLAAIASRTSQISLGTSVTVLSSDDPVRVYESFATLDAISGGRAEITLGRGSFTESFPLFGYDLRDYEVLFEEKLDLFSKLLAEKPVRWSGTTRPPLVDVDVFPKTPRPIPAWVGVGGTPASVVRTAKHGLNLMLAIIGGSPSRFHPLVAEYHRQLVLNGHSAGSVGAYSSGHIADTDEQALEEAYQGFAKSARRIGGERGWREFTREQFLHAIGPDGSTYVGSPQTVARKIAATVRTLRLSRFDLNYATGPSSPDQLLHSIELFGTKVIPLVRELVA
ncbi:MAG: LLM class flavin-dependent oxidoreductase [Propionicimonas sp.]|uniref:LLM class flavin-dependent oxidoreductase n=1 Tax=Propionicimonas sp. TaxID=1955623 RepID=UPI002B210EE2|nr:LLM class flavin-dependent oxidoreductase [Propionicimonas sp.]MEA4944431.1 LLM class flavin-dependent oxidoreductase [Propionicimonas sp.]